ncbi:hypothetical protein [Streptomyces sp. ST2-7A]|uniref:hypothetical protein n=1 Tax=Streptomyces sp. ST2-7A TaxID=2907214 RepID=UPI001F385410|nr:hypothetical protein [Streptomyces sp. ST2-7A]MCE7080162.1 hypothetical protein [Streptomyces sp. ST2-7A]
MNGSATYAEAAGTLEEVIDPDNGLLPRLHEFFEAAAEQANAFEDIEGWQLADRFTDAAGQLADLWEELADSADELRALGPSAPGWQPGAAVSRSTTAHCSPSSPCPEAASAPSPPTARTEPRHTR